MVTCDLLFAKAKNVAFPAQCKQETTVAHIVIIAHEQCQVENFQTGHKKFNVLNFSWQTKFEPCAMVSPRKMYAHVATALVE